MCSGPEPLERRRFPGMRAGGALFFWRMAALPSLSGRCGRLLRCSLSVIRSCVIALLVLVVPQALLIQLALEVPEVLIVPPEALEAILVLQVSEKANSTSSARS